MARWHDRLASCMCTHGIRARSLAQAGLPRIVPRRVTPRSSSYLPFSHQTLENSLTLTAAAVPMVLRRGYAAAAITSSTSSPGIGRARRA